MSNQPIKVLLIDDNTRDARLIHEMLIKAEGDTFNLEFTNQLSTGLEQPVTENINVLLLDLDLPDNQRKEFKS